MAKASSIVKLNGKVGEVVFFERNGKTIVRTKRANLSQRIKEDEGYAGHRERTQYLKLSNSFATAIYRMAKMEAKNLNFRAHHQLVKYIYQAIQVSDVNKLSFNEIRSLLKGLVLNFLDTLPPVSVSIYEDDLLLSCDRQIKHPVQLKLLIGTLPKVKKSKDAFKAEVNMETVEFLTFTVHPEDHLQNILIPVALQPNQVVVAIINHIDGDKEKEWVRVV